MQATVSIARFMAALLLANLIGGASQAKGVTPYLPLNLSPEIERDIERVLVLGDQPALTRPIAAARVMDALPKACKRDAKLCARVHRFLNRYMDKSGIAFASIEASTASNAQRALPNRRGLTSESKWHAAAASYLQLNDYILIAPGIEAYDGKIQPTGSVVSLGFDYAQLDVGYRDHWFSPMTDSSMLIGTQAATMPSVTLSNYTPMTRLGLRYELFLARMSASDRIAFQGGYTDGNPRLAGMHLSIEPASGWSLGGNRIMQFGGGERGGSSVKDFFNALFKPHDYDNTSASLNSDQEFGNQAAAWTSRMLFPGRVPLAVYFEYAGEDASYSGNYRLGNAALSAGIDFPQLWQSFDLTYEFSDWQNGWYVHGIYQDGLTNDGRVLGHWFGEQRHLNDGVGGQSHMLRLGWQPRFGGDAEFRYRTLQNAAYTGGNYARAHEITLRYSYPWRNTLVGAELDAGRDVFSERFARIAAFMRFGTENLQHYDDTSDVDAWDHGVSYFVDAGTSASKVRVNLADGPADPYITNIGYAPHLGIGARRSVSDHSDLGARLELDRIDDNFLLAVRALDYRYRWNDHFAIAAFAGAARYDVATPAFGYYGGLGAQWQHVFKHVDLSLDVRYGDKIARDKLLPNDPAASPRPDMFFDLMGATLYFSWRL